MKPSHRFSIRPAIPVTLLLAALVCSFSPGTSATGIPLRDLTVEKATTRDQPLDGPECTMVTEEAAAKVDAKTGIVRTIIWLPRGETVKSVAWKAGAGFFYSTRRMGSREAGFTQIISNGNGDRAIALVVTSRNPKLNDARLLPRINPAALAFHAGLQR